MDKDKGFFVVVTNKQSLIEVCYRKTVLPTGLWRAEDPSVSSLPILAMQLISFMSITGILLITLKPLRQPCIVAEILGGVLLGPTLLAEHPFFFFNVLPFRSMRTLETLGNLAIVYHMYLVGLELDFKPVIRSGKKALSIAFAGIIFSVPVGWVLHRHLLLKDFTNQNIQANRNGPIFWGFALATTNFPDLARIPADLKLLHSEVGRLVLSSAVIRLVVLVSFTARNGSSQYDQYGSGWVHFGLYSSVHIPNTSGSLADVNPRERKKIPTIVIVCALFLLGWCFVLEQY